MFAPQSADPANASPDMAKGLRRYDKVKDLERGAEPGFHHKVLVRGRQEGRRGRKMPHCCFEEGGGAASQGAQASSSCKWGEGFSPGSSRRRAAQPPRLQPSETLV